MKEMMIDLETLDVKSSAVVLSIGAVVFECFEGNQNVGGGKPRALDYTIVDRFQRILKLDDQLQGGRTVSQSTLLWWMQQDQDARDEAFCDVRLRQHPYDTMNELQEFVDNHGVTTRTYERVGEVESHVEDVTPINKFWASPVSFDFGIWNSLADDMNHSTPWTYRQVFDVRTVLNEASYSAKGHVLSRTIHGKAHMPVRDCEVQIDELVAARNKIGRRMS